MRRVLLAISISTLLYSATTKAMQHAMHFGRRRLIWHRHRDLRLHDNPFYHVNDDAKNPVQCIPVFIFDESEFTPRPSTCRPQHWNAVNVGPHAARILLESVHDLRRSLRQRGGELHIRQGSTLPILLQLIQETQATEVVWNQEPGLYEQEQSQKVQRAIASRFPKVTMHLCADATLYHPDDLPRTTDEWEQCAHPKKQPSKRKQNQNGGKKTYESFSHSRRHHVEDISTSRFEGIPPVMGDFRRAARVKAQIRPCLDTPSSACQWETTSLDAGDIPTLEDLIQPILTSTEKPILGMPQSLIEQICRHAMEQYNNNNQENPNVVVRGGETRALHHLQDFCQHYAATAQRNLACVDPHQSSRLSHFLAFGCVSPRKIVEQAERQNNVAKDGECNWLISHTTMRDFFLYTCIATGKDFYSAEGIPVNNKAAESLVWKKWDDETLQQWERWATGQTGLPLIDAAMREMIQTGYCSNRVRQNAASVLTKDLGTDWRAGAEWFQFLLSDHCVGANWGNWLYFSGKGSDPKTRHFRTVSQALKYDANGIYVMKWLPELRDFVTKVDPIHGDIEAYLRPWDFQTKQNQWKGPIVPPDTQYTWLDLQRLEGDGCLFDFG